MAFVETPRTNLGDTTELGYDGIENVSPEKSWHPPQNQENNLVAKLRGQRGLDLRTPNSRNPLALRPNQPNAQVPAEDEISLLLKSTRRPAPREKPRGHFGVPKTPAALKNGYREVATPALETGDSLLLSSEAGSYADGRTPLPAIPSSSAQSTPLADLGGNKLNGLVSDARNQMTLREQENIIDKLEKDNFGLKLKIHYLEDILRKADPNYSQTAVKENADLKVERIQLQREASKLRKQLKSVEHEFELVRQRLQDQELAGRQSTKSGSEARGEADRLRQELEDMRAEMARLEDELSQADAANSRIERLEGDVQDLEAELRQKDVEINDRDEKLEKMDERIEELQAEAEKMDERIEGLQSEAEKHDDERKDRQDQSEQVEELQEKINDLETDYRSLERELDLSKDAKDEAEQQRDEALGELKDLRDEMADRSTNSKGFAEEIERKAKKLERELREALAKHDTFEQQISTQQAETRQVQTRLDLSREEATSRETSLKEKITDYERKIQNFAKLHQSTDTQFQTIRQDLEARTDERDGLQVKYDSLLQESQRWKLDLEECKREVQELQEEVEFERKQAADNEAALREETNADREDLQGDVYDLKRRLESVQDQLEAEQEKWESEKRQLSMHKEQAESRVGGLEETIAQMRAARDDISGKETQLKDVLAAEEQRHRREENLLQGQLEQMQLELKQKQHSLDQLRAEHARIKDEAWLFKQEGSDAERKLQALEDEVQVLTKMLEDEQKRGQEKTTAARKEADAVRRELLDARQAKQRIESSLKDAQEHAQQVPQTPAATRSAKHQLEQRVREQDLQLEKLRHQAETLQTKLNRAEDDCSTARRRTAELESDLRQTLATKSAGSPPRATILNDSARKELDDLRRQIRDARRETDEAREKRKTVEKELRAKLIEAESTSRQRLLSQDQLRDDFEARIAELESQLRDAEALRQSAEKTVSRLRTRTDGLEKDLKVAVAASRQSRDDTALSQREGAQRSLKESQRSLEEAQTSLREAHREAEALRGDLAAATAKLQIFREREGEQRAIVKRLRGERSEATARTSALDQELAALRQRHGRRADELRTRADELARREAEAGSMARRLREATAEADRARSERSRDTDRHRRELDGLGRQIRWLRAKARREQEFRAGLAFEKKFLLMNVDMYQTFNRLDLGMLRTMGVDAGIEGVEGVGADAGGVGQLTTTMMTTKANAGVKGKGRSSRNTAAAPPVQWNMSTSTAATTATTATGKPRSLRAAAYAFIAVARMRRAAQQWREHRQVKESLLRQAQLMDGGGSGVRKDRNSLGKRNRRA